MRSIHRFDNGISVYDDQLVPAQRLRYARRNVHEEDEEDLFLSLIDRLPPDAVFVSVGSAIGYYALLAKRRRPDLVVHCVEPLERHRRYLVENIGLNGFIEADVRLHALAVAPGAGEHLLVDQDFGSFLVRPDDARSMPTVSVRSVPLSGLRGPIGSAVVDLMQMDIQGLEASVLEGFFAEPARELAVGAFLIGTHGRLIHDRCRTALRARGYELVHDQVDAPNQPDGILAARLP